MLTNANTVRVNRGGSRFLRAKWALLALTVAALVGIERATAQVVAREKPTSAHQKADLSYPEAAEEARRNTPPAGGASMYVLRPSKTLGMVGCFFLELDDRTWGGLANGQYSWDPLSPGAHSFKRTVRGRVSLQAEAGKTYYVVISAGGLGTGGVKFVSQEEGEKIRRKLSLNPDRWLLRQYLANWSSVHVGMTLEEVKHFLRLSEGPAIFEGEPKGGLTFSFRSMLGYFLHFENGILTAKLDNSAAGLDSHLCPAPTVTR